MPKLLTERKIIYPESDGKPMAETGIHVAAIMLLHSMLEDFLQPKHKQVWIASNIYWFYERGEPKCRVSPDTMVILDCPVGDKSFFSWKQDAVRPEIVFEITSRKTRKQDTLRKHELYQSLGVPEYVLFDPTEDFIFSGLIYYRLVNGLYQEMPTNGRGAYESLLGFNFGVRGSDLRLIDRESGSVIPSRREMVELQQRFVNAAAEKVELETQRADRLSRELEQLKALLNLKQSTNGHHS